MKPYVAINASALVKKNKTGVEWYTSQLLKYLAREWQESDPPVVLFVPQKPKNTASIMNKNWRIKILPGKFFWTQYHLLRFLKRYPPLTLFSPSYVAPRFLPPKISTINVVHGLEGEHFPEFRTLKQIVTDHYLTIPAIKKSSLVIAVSEHTRHDLFYFYHLPPKKIKTVLSGPGTIADKKIGCSLVRKKDKVTKFLFLGGSNERKNLKLALRIFFLLKRKFKNIHLTVTGKINPPIENIIKEKNITFLGYISEAEKKKQLKNAHFLLYSSFYEGFGFPVLEAQASGTVPITLKGSSLEEVGGDGIVKYDPRQEKKFLSLIVSLVKDQKKYSQMQKKGLKNIQRFSWQTCAKEIKKVLVNFDYYVTRNSFRKKY